MSYRAKYNLIGIPYVAALIILLFVFLLGYDKHPTFLLLFIIYGYYALALTILEIYIKSLDRILYRHCDPERFLTLILRNYPEKSRKYRSMGVTHKIIRGLCAAGRFEEALAELNKIDDFPEGSFSDPLKRFYYEYLVSIYIDLNNLPQAEIALEALNAIAQDKDLSIVIKKTIKKQYEASALLLNMAKGRFEGAEEFFTGRFKSAKNNYARVLAKYYLGIIYSHFGDTAKALEAFEYAAAHGNKLYLASLARENLKKT